MLIVLVFAVIDLFNEYLLNVDNGQGLAYDNEQNGKRPWPCDAQILLAGYRQYRNKYIKEWVTWPEVLWMWNVWCLCVLAGVGGWGVGAWGRLCNNWQPVWTLVS